MHINRYIYICIHTCIYELMNDCIFISDQIRIFFIYVYGCMLSIIRSVSVCSGKFWVFLSGSEFINILDLSTMEWSRCLPSTQSSFIPLICRHSITLMYKRQSSIHSHSWGEGDPLRLLVTGGQFIPGPNVTNSAYSVTIKTNDTTLKDNTKMFMDEKSVTPTAESQSELFMNENAIQYQPDKINMSTLSNGTMCDNNKFNLMNVFKNRKNKMTGKCIETQTSSEFEKIDELKEKVQVLEMKVILANDTNTALSRNIERWKCTVCYERDIEVSQNMDE